MAAAKMRKVMHGDTPTWGNLVTKSEKPGWIPEYRCTKCGSRDHKVVKE